MRRRYYFQGVPGGGAGGWGAGGGGAPAAPNIRPPEQNRIVGTFDPNYQTLAGLNNEDVFKKKASALLQSSCFLLTA